MGYTERGRHYVPETMGEAVAAVTAMQKWKEEEARQAAEKAAKSLKGRIKKVVEAIKREI